MYSTKVFIILVSCMVAGACAKKSGDTGKATGEAGEASDTGNESGEKEPSKATAESVCKNLVAIGMADSADDCPKKLEDLQKVFAEKYEESFECLSAAKTQPELGLCITKYSDPEKLAAEFDTFQKKSKSAETAQYLSKLHDALRSYYSLSMEPNPKPEAVKLGVNDKSKSLPPSVGPMPAKGACCEKGDQCEPKEEHWSDPTWKALDFQMRDSHYYSYEYKRNDDGKGFVLSAYGDLDCDGTYSTFRLNGVVGDDGEIESRTEIEKENPLE